MVIEVTARTLVMKTVKQDGTVLDTFSIDKMKDTDSDMARAPIPSKSWVKYAVPTLVVFGNVVSPAMVRHAPVLREGKWYVDLGALAAALGAAVNVTDAGTSLAVSGKDLPLAPEQLWTDNKVVLAPADVLAPLGFLVAFHEATNLLEVTR